MFVTYSYRNNLSRYAAGFVDTERREGPESLTAAPTGGRTSASQKSHAIHKHE